jgi:tetratricopeptide (TPR) repeat protein
MRYWLFLAFVVCGLAGLSSPTNVRGQDVVYTRSEKGEVPRKGTIVDWTGSYLKIEIGGRERSLNQADIVRVETTWSKEYQQAESLFAERQFQPALEAFRGALQQEPRGWAQNMILARMVQCADVLDNPAAAGVAFLQILSVDPQTRFIHLIPLPWASSFDPGISEQADSWMQVRNPTVKLIGASWMLGSPKREEAREILEALAQDLDPNVAHLAKLQLWRAKVVTAKAADLARLKAQVERMPKDLRGPALLILSDIQSRLKMNDQATLTLMRIPILHSENLKLSAMALKKAALKQEAAGEKQSAIRLYREVVSDFGGTQLAQDAAAQLQRLQVERK